MKKLLVIMVLPMMGCASAMNYPAEQELSVKTNPSGGVCTLTNEKGSWTVQTPGTVTIIRSADPVKLNCVKGSMKGRDNNWSLPYGAGWMSGALGPIGASTDSSVGRKYSDEITVELK